MTNYQLLTAIVTPACEQFGVEELSLFGSRVRGDACAESDFDFVVLFDRTRAGKLSDRFFGLLFHLEDHLAAPIDLLEQNAIRNPFLRQTIAQEKKVIYCARSEEATL
jgi:uncharacterized protein